MLACSLLLSSCVETETAETSQESSSVQSTTAANDPSSTEQNESPLPDGWEKTTNETITYLAIKDTVVGADWSNFSNDLGENYGKIVTYMTENNIEQGGMPLTQWLTFEESGNSIYTAGIPVAPDTKPGPAMEIVTIPAGNAFKYIHKGAYDATEAAHESINKYMYSTGNTPIGAPWEIYVTDPGMEPDTSKWVTEIWYPIGE